MRVTRESPSSKVRAFCARIAPLAPVTPTVTTCACVLLAMFFYGGFSLAAARSQVKKGCNVGVWAVLPWRHGLDWGAFTTAGCGRNRLRGESTVARYTRALDVSG